MALVMILVFSVMEVGASPSRSLLRRPRWGFPEDFDQENLDTESSFADFPRTFGITDHEDVFDTHPSPFKALETSLFEDLSRPGIPQFEGPASGSSIRLLAPHHAATPHKSSFSFQTSSSSSSSFVSDVDGHIHEQVMQERTQKGGDGKVAKSLSAARFCVDGDCKMKTVQSTAPVPGVEFVEGVTMSGPQGGALDRHMSLMLGMDNRQENNAQKNNSQEGSVDPGVDTEPAGDAPKREASSVSQKEQTSEASGRASPSANASPSPMKGPSPAELDRPEIIMLTPTDDDM
jgi:hypothetical protein